MELKRALIRVLLVEDNVGFAYGVRDMLVRQGNGKFCVSEAHTLAEGLAILKREPVDVVLLDLGLPDSARLETFSRVHSQAPGVPVIVLTVLDDDDVALGALRDGGQDYLVKDQVNRNLLVRSIRYALERSAIERDLRLLSARVLVTQDEERRRIALVLHEVTGQNLAALSMNLTLLRQHEAQMDSKARELLAETDTMARQCSDDLRTMAYLLHPPLLDELGLAGAVRDYADGFAKRSGIRVDLELPPKMPELSKDTQIALFRVMQECLTNIHRHSGSRTASILFSRAPGEISLEVRDNGCGLSAEREIGDAARPVLGVGIAGMRERLSQLGGRLKVAGGPGKGTMVLAVLPLREEAP